MLISFVAVFLLVRCTILVQYYGNQAGTLVWLPLYVTLQRWLVSFVPKFHSTISRYLLLLHTAQEFSPNVIRDSSFPPDSGCGGSDSSTSKVLPDIKPPLGFNFSAAGGPGIEGGLSGVSQHLKWQAHMVNTWMDLCDGALQDMWVWVCNIVNTVANLN